MNEPALCNIHPLKKTALPDLGETVTFEVDVKVGKKTYGPNTEFEVTDANDQSVQLSKGKDSSYFTMGELKANGYAIA